MRTASGVEPEGARLPGRFEAAFSAFLAGKGNLAEVRRELANSLFASLEPATAIEQACNEALQAGSLTASDHRKLVGDIELITTEETPTDVPVDASTPSTAKSRPKQAVKRTAARPVGAKGAVRRPKPAGRARRSVAERVERRGTDRRKPEKVEIRIGAILRERFQLEERVAGGRMGEVYRAVDRLKRDSGYADPAVAIKVLSKDLRDCPDALNLLKQEALKAQRLSHPNIVNVYDLDHAGDHYFIAMEWLRGESLAAMLDRSRPRPLPADQVAKVLDGVAAGLEYAHQQGMVHGDIKPGNIFFCRSGQVKLLDFGLARAPEAGHENDREGPYAMTRAYASCEMLEGKEPNVQDDVYALACVVYRMLAGYRPYGNRTVLEAERDGHKLRRPRDLTTRQWKTLKSGLAFRRADRLQTVDQLWRGICAKPAASKRGAWALALPAGIALAVAGVISSEYLADPAQFDDVSANWRATLRSVFVDPQIDSRSDAAATDDMTVVIPAPAEEFSGEELETLPPAFDDGIAAVTDDPDTAAAYDEALGLIVPPIRDDRADERVDVTEVDDPVPAESEPAVAFAEPESSVPQAAPEPAIAGLPETDPVQTENLPAFAESVTEPAASQPAVTVPPAAPYRPSGFVKSRYEVNESDVFVRIPIRYPAGTDRPVELTVVVMPGSATEREDFVPPATTRFRVRPGETDASLLIPLVSDEVPENVEDIMLRLFADLPDVSLDNDRALIIVLDDD